MAQPLQSLPGPHRILIVDDNPSVHDAFERILGAAKPDRELEAEESIIFGEGEPSTPMKPEFHLDHVFSGQEAIDQVAASASGQQPYELAFVDIRMPGMDGVKTIEAIWKQDARMQAVICTAYADYLWRDLAAKFGRTGDLLVLKKPFHDIEVLQLASALTQKWRLNRQAALSVMQLESLVAQRTERVLELQRRERELDQLRLQSFEQLARELRAPLTLMIGALEDGDGGLSAGQKATAGRQARALLEMLDNSLPVRPPAAAAPADIALNAAAPEETSDKESALLLLIVESADLRRSIKDGLGEAYRFSEESMPAGALSGARELVPDVIVLDGDGSQGNALAVCAQLKNDEVTSHIPIILLGEDLSDAIQVEALNRGVDDCLSKPFHLPLLRARIDNLLERRRKFLEQVRESAALFPRELAATRPEAEFLQRVTDAVSVNMADYEFDVAALGQRLGISRRQLFRKFKAIAGCTPNTFIRDLRLKRAARLLRESQMTISEIIYAVGFSDPKHFRAVFKERFGVLPAEYAKEGASM